MITDDLIVTRSAFAVDETVDRLAAALTSAGNTVFARIDHAANAAAAGLEMRPTQVLIFGNGKAGTPLMLSSPTLALDLPLKFLVWEDDAGATQLAYTPLAVLARRHGLGGFGEQIAALDGRLATLSALVRLPDELSPS